MSIHDIYVKTAPAKEVFAVHIYPAAPSLPTVRMDHSASRPAAKNHRLRFAAGQGTGYLDTALGGLFWYCC